MNSYIKGAFEALINSLPLKNIIIFESSPDCSDNARAVFDELLGRGVNQDYTLVWALHKGNSVPADLAGINNVIGVNMNSAKYKYYYSYFARAFAVSNYFMQKRRGEQYYIYLAHGAAMKAIRDKRYSVPKDCYGCDFCVYSKYIGELDIENLNTKVSDVNMLETGYARNDVLFKESKRAGELFSSEKYIYWLPTFRQKKDDNSSVSSVAIPIIHNPEAVKQLNKCAAEYGITLVIKPHPAQDVTKINTENLSNIRFIDNDFLVNNCISNYELLAGSAALLSDYSSVYYDYLLCDKPIGLCVEDYAEYAQNEGFRVNYNEITKCAEKIYTADELCKFISDIANERDIFREERNAMKALIHKYADSDSSKRIADRIMSSIK